MDTQISVHFILISLTLCSFEVTPSSLDRISSSNIINISPSTASLAKLSRYWERPAAHTAFRTCNYSDNTLKVYMHRYSWVRERGRAITTNYHWSLSMKGNAKKYGSMWKLILAVLSYMCHGKLYNSSIVLCIWSTIQWFCTESYSLKRRHSFGSKSNQS